MSKLNSKLMKAEAIARTGKVIVPGLGHAQLVYMLTCLRVEELDAVYRANVVEWFNQRDAVTAKYSPCESCTISYKCSKHGGQS